MNDVRIHAFLQNGMGLNIRNSPSTERSNGARRSTAGLGIRWIWRMETCSIHWQKKWPQWCESSAPAFQLSRDIRLWMCIVKITYILYSHAQIHASSMKMVMVCCVTGNWIHENIMFDNISQFCTWLTTHQTCTHKQNTPSTFKLQIW